MNKLFILLTFISIIIIFFKISNIVYYIKYKDKDPFKAGNIGIIWNIIPIIVVSILTMTKNYKGMLIFLPLYVIANAFTSFFSYSSPETGEIVDYGSKYYNTLEKVEIMFLPFLFILFWVLLVSFKLK